ncbi:hypothetical protein [Candidatus Electrothrix sp.]|uniref:hypothetical protein n=1 Tax=Candidatus Electrothrix sp. TaxID=2170559 RepID=UPI0040574DE4
MKLPTRLRNEPIFWFRNFTMSVPKQSLGTSLTLGLEPSRWINENHEKRFAPQSQRPYAQMIR